MCACLVESSYRYRTRWFGNRSFRGCWPQAARGCPGGVCHPMRQLILVNCKHPPTLPSRLRKTKPRATPPTHASTRAGNGGRVEFSESALSRGPRAVAPLVTASSRRPYMVTAGGEPGANAEPTWASRKDTPKGAAGHKGLADDANLSPKCRYWTQTCQV